MPANQRFSQVSLDNLLQQLHLRGIPVGILELQRLQAVFVTAPDLSRAELRGLLCSLLAKDDRQRRVISHLFEQLIPYDVEDTPDKSAANTSQSLNKRAIDPDTDEQEAEQLIEEKEKRFSTWHYGLMVAVLLLIAGLITVVSLHKGEEKDVSEIEIPPKPVINQQQEEKITKKHQHKLKLAEQITLWTPEIIAVEAYPVWQKSLPALLLFIGSGIGFFWLLQQALQRTRERKATPQYIIKRGRSWLPALQKQPDYHLLSADARREMSWGISHYLSDQPLKKLDIPLSVAASAKQGLPSLHFCNAQREREVWIWQDRSSRNPYLATLANEIAQTLRSVNVASQQGYFHALPDKISNQHGEVIWSIQHEYPENQPLVIILSDSERLNQLAMRQDERCQHTLHQLSHWQNLCFVDCSTHTGTLCQLLQDLPLECLPSQDIAHWLARQGQMRETSVTECKLDDLHRWAIACALPDRSLMEAEVRALHEALRLDCSWQYHHLQRYARQSAKGLDFHNERYGLLHDFSQLAQLGDIETDFIQRTLSFWQQRYSEIDQLSAKQETPRFQWHDSQRQSQLKLEMALLALWQFEDLNNAVETLYDLHQHKGKFPLARDVERKLGQYTCLDWHEATTSAERIVLPYQWQNIEGKTQQQLKAMGFGGQPEQVGLSWNKATGVLLGGLAGIMLVGLHSSAESIWPLLHPHLAKVQIVANSPHPSSKLSSKSSADFFSNESNPLVIGHRKTGVFEQVDAPKNAIVHLRWHKQTAQAAQAAISKDGKVELWRLGEQEKPRRPENWFDMSIAVIQARPKSFFAQKLAAKLLDSGMVDQVIIGRKWEKTQNKIFTFRGHKKQHIDVQIIIFTT